MAILTATDALYMTLYKRCPSYLNEAEEAIKEALKNGKTEALITLSYIPSVFDESIDGGADELLAVCYYNTYGLCDLSNSDRFKNWFSIYASSLEHPKEEWFLQAPTQDPEQIKKATESYAFKFIKAKILLASYLVELGYKVTIEEDVLFGRNSLTVSWV